jgi:hypothetical protein
MKKLLGIFIALALFITSMSAVAAVKAGDVCKKAGSTATANGKKFTCIKSGKKLVWNKGVAVAKPKPVETVVPEATPTPSPTPTELTESDLRQRGIQKAFDEVANIAKKASPATANLEIIASGEIRPESIKVIQDRYNFVAGFFADLVNPDLPVTVVIGANAEINWIASKLEELSGNSYKQFLNAFESPSKGFPCGPYYTAGVSGKTKSGRLLNHYGLFGKSCPAQLPSDENFQSTIEHEWVHNVQGKLADPSMIGEGGQTLLPCWFKEGQASFYGNAIGYRSNYRGYLAVRRSTISNFENRLQVINQNLAGTLKDLDEKFNAFSCGNTGGYALGALAVEKMLLMKGHTGVIDFMKSVKSEQSWRKAFVKVYGVEADVWIDKIAIEMRLDFRDIGL